MLATQFTWPHSYTPTMALTIYQTVPLLHPTMATQYTWPDSYALTQASTIYQATTTTPYNGHKKENLRGHTATCNNKRVTSYHR